MSRWAWAGWLLLAAGCTVAVPDLPPPDAVPSLTVGVPEGVATITLTPTQHPSSTPTPTPSATPTPHPDAIMLASAGQVRQVLVLRGHHGPVWGVAISPDGSQVASASSDHDVRLWDAYTGEAQRVLEQHRGWVYDVGYSPGGTQLVSAGRDQTVRVWDAINGAYLYGMRTFGEGFRLDFAPDGTRVAVASLYSARGQMWPLEPGASWVALEGHATRLRSVAFSPDGRTLATGDAEGTVMVRDATTGEPIETLATGSAAMGLAFSPDGAWLAVGSGDGTLRVYDVARREEQVAWPAHAGGVWDVIYAPQGDFLVSGGLDGLVGLWDAESFARLATLQHGAAVRAVDVSRDGTTIASGGDDGQVRLWRVAK